MRRGGKQLKAAGLAAKEELMMEARLERLERELNRKRSAQGFFRARSSAGKRASPAEE